MGSDADGAARSLSSLCPWPKDVPAACPARGLVLRLRWLQLPARGLLLRLLPLPSPSPSPPPTLLVASVSFGPSRAASTSRHMDSDSCCCHRGGDSAAYAEEETGTNCDWGCRRLLRFDGDDDDDDDDDE